MWCFIVKVLLITAVMISVFSVENAIACPGTICDYYINEGYCAAPANFACGCGNGYELQGVSFWYHNCYQFEWEHAGGVDEFCHPYLLMCYRWRACVNDGLPQPYIYCNPNGVCSGRDVNNINGCQTRIAANNDDGWFTVSVQPSYCSHDE